MEKKLNKDIVLYINSLNMTHICRRIIITDLEKVIYDNSTNNYLKLKEDFTKTLNNLKELKIYNFENTINIFDEDDNKIVSQLILPINDENKKTCGAIILLSTKYIFDNIATEFAKSIKYKIESTYKNNSNLTDIDKNLILDNNYMNINYLIYYIIDELECNLEEKDFALVKKLENLLEQKKELALIHSLASSKKNI